MMDKAAITELISERKFTELFIEHGWDHVQEDSMVIQQEGGLDIVINVVTHKRGFVICECKISKISNLKHKIVARIMDKIKQRYYEHLLIIHGNNDSNQKEQLWCLNISPKNKPVRIIIERWNESQSIDKLLARLKGLVFTLKEENNISLTFVHSKVLEAFSVNVEKVTKKFYTEFKKTQNNFKSHLSMMTIDEQEAFSVSMLNRLMFTYFVQKKGLLNNDLNYLQNKLKVVKEEVGENSFDKFYRKFLKALFHEGLDKPVSQRKQKIQILIGNVPFFNGGLFQKTILEEKYETINIPDKAFEVIFKFFDKYTWYLDDRAVSSGKEINPDVLGYIFEKYITDKAEKGAYYTQMDVTDYISKTSILPNLLNETKKKCENAFRDINIWNLITANPTRYIYRSIRYGVDGDDFYCRLPNIIKKRNSRNVVLKSTKDILNTSADEKYTEYNETWREVLSRRKRYEKLIEVVLTGKITSVEMLVEYNFDITLFVTDVLAQYEGHDFIEAFFRTMAGVKKEWLCRYNKKIERGLSILDPACGSGAFLFSALNLMAPLYEICIDRMKEYVTTHQKSENDFTYSRNIVKYIKAQSSEYYWIIKNIIIENLFGVDIMPGAVETAKLRLFLKLAAYSEYNDKHENFGIEPLPDIDFNIRTGNGLVGFASTKQLSKLVTQKLPFDEDDYNDIIDRATEVKEKYNEFKASQLGERYTINKVKAELVKSLTDLTSKLNQYSYMTCKSRDSKSYNKWYEDSHPFHWFANFYEIIEEKNGFDVIIGNPPYVEKSTLEYDIEDYYESEPCNNIYAHMIERSMDICNDKISMIVQLPLICTNRMQTIQKILRRHTLKVASFDDDKAKIFPDLRHCRVCIFHLEKAKHGDSVRSRIMSTKYNRWYHNERNKLFESLQMVEHPIQVEPSHIKEISYVYKFGSKIDVRIYKKLMQTTATLGGRKKGNAEVYYHNTPINWVRSMNYLPPFHRASTGLKRSTQYKTLYFETEKVALSASALLNSSLFYWFYVLRSDCWHLNLREIDNFPINIDLLARNKYIRLEPYYEKLMETLKSHSKIRKRQYAATGDVEYAEISSKAGKHIIDEIDIIIGEELGLTVCEIEHIINYDVKYRMSWHK